MSDEDNRLLVESEFIQNLANPKYLNYLAQEGFLEQPQFINYLIYLRYWKKPEYMQYLVFPQCLEMLDALIDNRQFRRELTVGRFIEFIHQQQGLLWMKTDDII